MAKRHDAYMLLLEFGEQLSKSIYQRKVVEEKMLLNEFTRTDSGVTTAATRNLIYSSIAAGVTQGLTKSAKLFIMDHMVDQLKKYNLLWHRPKVLKSQDLKVLRELVDIRFIFPTETTGIYLINPLKIFKVNPITCVEATKQLLRDNGKPCYELIKDLRPGDKYIVRTGSDHFKLLSDGFTPTLLHDDSPSYPLDEAM